ncbi:serine hydrolase domain-containing protein [Streptomyces sp. NPDC001852]|uniref:serine hydrolase domain-containing protein n=1 Tax=Streptomyces sp. NPDC001852 TaxID=3364619 RepID=UPI00367D0472
MKTLAHRVAAVGLVGAALAGLGAGFGPQAFAAGGTRASSAPAFPSLDPAALQAAIQTRPTDDAAGAIARVEEPGQLWKGSTIDSQTGRKISPNAHFHIGSISKVFETTVILQLAAEGRIDLDQTVQHYMPGLFPDTFQPITVRELVNYTSGLPDVDEGKPAASVDETIADRYRYRTFDEIINTTLRPNDRRPWPGPHFTPGTKQEYNSLGFRIAGKLIEQITGHSFREEVTTRILKPLHLNQTSVPENDPVMPRPYLHGYITDGNGTAVDVSEQGGDPSNMISTPADLDRFITALFQGRLLPADQLNEMFTVPKGSDGNPVPFIGTSCNKQACFGAGLMSTPLPGGGVLWGKTGHDDGYANGMFATRDLSLRGIYSVSNLSLDFGAPTPLANRLLTAVLNPTAPRG